MTEPCKHCGHCPSCGRPLRTTTPYFGYPYQPPPFAPVPSWPTTPTVPGTADPRYTPTYLS